MYREYVDAMVTSCAELFPTEIKQGYTWHDSYHSKKMPEISVRRIKLSALDDNGKAKVLTLVPSFIMPYMCGDTDEIEKALFLRRFGVPYWGLTYVFDLVGEVKGSKQRRQIPWFWQLGCRLARPKSAVS
jgi:hypothetical protein